MVTHGCETVGVLVAGMCFIKVMDCIGRFARCVGNDGHRGLVIQRSF